MNYLKNQIIINNNNNLINKRLIKNFPLKKEEPNRISYKMVILKVRLII